MHSKSFNFIYILFHGVWYYCTQRHSILYTYRSMESDVIALKIIQFYIHIVPSSLMLLHSKSFNFIYILFNAVWCYFSQSHSILYTYCSMQSDVIALKVIQFCIHIGPCSLMLLHSKSFNFIYILSMESDVIALKVIQFYIHIVPCSLMLLHSKSFNFIYILFHGVWCNCTQSHSILYTYCSMESDVIALKVIQFYIHIVPCSLMLLHSKSFNFIYILFHAVWCYCTQSHSILYTYCSMHSDVIALKVIQFYIHIVPWVWCYCTQSHSILYTYCSMQSDVIALKVIQFYIHIVPCSLMLLHSKSFNFIYILFHAVWCYCTQSHSILYTYCSMQSDVIALKVIQFYIHIVPCSLSCKSTLHSKSFNFIYILFHAVWCYCTQSHSILYTYCSMQSDVIALKVIQFYIHIVPCSLMLLHSKSFNFIYILFHAVWCNCTQSHSILYTYCSMQSDVIALKVIQFYIHIVPCSLMLLHSKSFNFIYILFHAVWCYCTQSHSILYTYCSIAVKVIQFYIHIVPWSLMFCMYILFHGSLKLHSKSFNFIYILFHAVWCYCTQSHSILYTYCSMQSDVIALKVIQFYIHIVPCSLMLLHSKSFNFIYILFHAVWC